MDRPSYVRDRPNAEADNADLYHKPSSNSATVAKHYNEIRELGVEGRLYTKITGLRLFNNWVKSCLIRQYTKRGNKVLDLGCGKGGDLRKWSMSNISEYVGMDIADVSVGQAQRRYKEMNNNRFEARFYAQDCYGEPLEKTLRPVDYKADVVSTQFCLHYAFESEAKARQMMANVSTHMEPGAYFMCTIPNANWLEKKRRVLGDSFGNSVYRVEFAPGKATRFGTAYSFSLDEAVQDCTEYLVHMPSFVQLAGEYGLELKDCIGFHHYYTQQMQRDDATGLFWRMRVIDEERPEISKDEWEAIGIYLVVVFRKMQ
ncbi:mRNA cap guanine-N7 methyltransferase [Coemansia biformis]|uniref:mRNA cap guanine-N(7) methyltransferase n=1 Tax=Coemansia biformis TaxID=1286918 RepID=A0A9W7YFX3_9FUNG|nr:mRNA cap guanine-N7 methyltransferase [Coemansia biformis]